MALYRVNVNHRRMRVGQIIDIDPERDQTWGYFIDQGWISEYVPPLEAQPLPEPDVTGVQTEQRGDADPDVQPDSARPDSPDGDESGEPDGDDEPRSRKGGERKRT